LLDALEKDPQSRLLPESRVDCLGEAEGLGKFTADLASLSRRRQLGVFRVSIIGRFGQSQAGLASAGAILARLLGRGEFLVNTDVQRRENSLGEAFLAAVPSVIATKWRTQQKEPDELWPDSMPPSNGCVGRQDQIPKDSVVTSCAFGAASSRTPASQPT
jgi:hypothetical protein